MSDIVGRLNTFAAAWRALPKCNGTYNLCASDLIEAAAEIERLRAVLGRIGYPGKRIIYCRDGHEEAVLIARQALKGGAK